MTEDFTILIGSNKFYLSVSRYVNEGIYNMVNIDKRDLNKDFIIMSNLIGEAGYNAIKQVYLSSNKLNIAIEQE